jgi:hypothetical protein
VVHIVTTELERVNHHSMKMYGGILLHISLTSALDVTDWLHAPAVIPPGKEPPVPIG